MGIKFRWIVAILSVAGISGVFSSCRPGDEYRKYEGIVWNTTFNIIYSSDRNLDDSVRIVMRDVELSLSPFNKASRITEINNKDSVEVDSMIIEVFDASLEINRRSGGLFDPTLAPLINAYGFGYKKDGNFTPDKEKIDSALNLVGISRCRIIDDRMIKKHPGTQFNFSAITKGFGVDEVARMLMRNGVEDYLVEIGGEIRVGGVNPDGKKWRIQIDAPVDNGSVPAHEQLMMLPLTDISVATSGNYRNNHTVEGGKKIGHTISPVTGEPVQNEYLSVTIFAPECMVADGWATAIMAGTPVDSLPSGISAITVSLSGETYLIERHNFQ